MLPCVHQHVWHFNLGNVKDADQSAHCLHSIPELFWPLHDQFMHWQALVYMQTARTQFRMWISDLDFSKYCNFTCAKVDYIQVDNICWSKGLKLILTLIICLVILPERNKQLINCGHSVKGLSSWGEIRYCWPQNWGDGGVGDQSGRWMMVTASQRCPLLQASLYMGR